MPRRGRQALRILLGASGLIVVATGLWLARSYRPGAMVVRADGSFTYRRGGGWVDGLHVWSARLAAVALVVTVGASFRSIGPRAKHVLAAGLLAAATILAFVSARGLRWDILALWAVTAGTSFEGVWGPAFDEQVRFILLPGDEVSPGEYRVRVVAHLVAAPLLLVATLLLLGRTVRQRSD